MYGAIFGDIIGSRFEFDRGGRTKDFELFTDEDDFTDDTVMTIAVGEALLKVGKDADVQTIREAVTEAMQDWGHRYPDAGYGGRFYGWLFDGRQARPYGSYGNGSAMRVSAAGWLYDSLERTREVAAATAEVTHNHPEGIKGAECTAAVMYLARTGKSKEEIADYVVREFGYDFSETLEEMRHRHDHVETCQDSLPKALRSFLDGDSYEDVVRNAVSLGGDTDTLAAIAGAMAETLYGVPAEIRGEGTLYLPKDIREVLDRFEKVLGREVQEPEQGSMAHNRYIRMAADQALESGETEDFVTLLRVLAKRIREDGEVLAPMEDVNHVMDGLDADQITPGDTLTLGQDLRLCIDKVKNAAEEIWVPLYTDEAEINKGQTPPIRVNLPIRTLLEEAANAEGVCGLVIDPFGDAVPLPKEAIRVLLNEEG